MGLLPCQDSHNLITPRDDVSYQHILCEDIGNSQLHVYTCTCTTQGNTFSGHSKMAPRITQWQNNITRDFLRANSPGIENSKVLNWGGGYMPCLRRLVAPYYLRYVPSLLLDGVTTLLLHALLSIPGFPTIPQDYPVIVTQFPASALLSILGFFPGWL